LFTLMKYLSGFPSQHPLPGLSSLFKWYLGIWEDIYMGHCHHTRTPNSIDCSTYFLPSPPLRLLN